MKGTIKQKHIDANNYKILLQGLENCDEITIKECTVDCMQTLHTLFTLLSQMPNLQSLKFVANRFARSISNPFILLLPLLANNFPQLKIFIFDTEPLNPCLAELILRAAIAKKIEDLRMINCGIDDNTLNLLSEQLEKNTFPFKNLSFANNKITDTGAIHLFNALSRKPSLLIELDISANQLSNKSLLHLAHILPSLKLKTLKCQSIKLDQLFIQALSNTIPTSSLTTLDFFDCNLSEESILSLLDSILNSPCNIDTIMTERLFSAENMQNLTKSKQIVQDTDSIKIIPPEKAASMQTDFFKNTSPAPSSLPALPILGKQNYCVLL